MYNDWFFEEEGAVARRSAEVVVPWLIDEVSPASVIDVGCGTGEWAAAAQAHGCDAYGVDGHVPEALLAINPAHFRQVDLPCEIDEDCWDLAICLELAEHLPAESAETLVAELAKAEAVLFSAATPGQPGIGHINCQPHEYWHELFAEHGKTPEFIGDKFTEPVADFYRRNMYLYR